MSSYIIDILELSSQKWLFSSLKHSFPCPKIPPVRNRGLPQFKAPVPSHQLAPKPSSPPASHWSRSHMLLRPLRHSQSIFPTELPIIQSPLNPIPDTPLKVHPSRQNQEGSPSLCNLLVHSGIEGPGFHCTH